MGAQSDYMASVIRSIVPVIVSLGLGWLARWGLDIPAEDFYGVVEAVVFGVYYSLVRLAEERRSSKAGWLLGLARPPHYAPPNRIVEQPGSDTIVVDEHPDDSTEGQGA